MNYTRSYGITTVVTIHPEGNMHACTICNGDSSNRCWDLTHENNKSGNTRNLQQLTVLLLKSDTPECNGKKISIVGHRWSGKSISKEAWTIINIYTSKDKQGREKNDYRCQLVRKNGNGLGVSYELIRWNTAAWPGFKWKKLGQTGHTSVTCKPHLAQGSEDGPARCFFPPAEKNHQIWYFIMSPFVFVNMDDLLITTQTGNSTLWSCLYKDRSLCLQVPGIIFLFLCCPGYNTHGSPRTSRDSPSYDNSMLQPQSDTNIQLTQIRNKRWKRNQERNGCCYDLIKTLTFFFPPLSSSTM